MSPFLRSWPHRAQQRYESWELDALDPTTLDALITATIDDYRDPDQWETDTDAMDADRDLLTEAASRWHEISAYLHDNPIGA